MNQNISNSAAQNIHVAFFQEKAGRKLVVRAAKSRDSLSGAWKYLGIYPMTLPQLRERKIEILKNANETYKMKFQEVAVR